MIDDYSYRGNCLTDYKLKNDGIRKEIDELKARTAEARRNGRWNYHWTSNTTKNPFNIYFLSNFIHIFTLIYIIKQSNKSIYLKSFYLSFRSHLRPNKLLNVAFFFSTSFGGTLSTRWGSGGFGMLFIIGFFGFEGDITGCTFGTVGCLDSSAFHAS